MSDYERELGWDDEIEQDSPDWVLLVPGEYDFEVVDFERSRHNGSAKLPACNKAIVHIRMSGQDEQGNEGTTTLKHNLFLHSKTEGILSAFFTSIGQRKKGEKYTMNWNKVIGSKGRARIATRSWTGDDGEERWSNEIKRFLEPEEKGFEPGKF